MPRVIEMPRLHPKVTLYKASIQCLPGLEQLVAKELSALNINSKQREIGRLTAVMNTRQLYAVNVFSRFATRVLVDTASFTAKTFSQMEHEVKRLDWSNFLQDQRPRIRVKSYASKLYHEDAIATRLYRDLPSGEGAEQPILVRVVHDRFTVRQACCRPSLERAPVETRRACQKEVERMLLSPINEVRIDSSGDPLHKRGWRRDINDTPLRETVAAALIASSGWDPHTPLVDPFCGSGTIAIEAALHATGQPANLERAFAFESWPCFMGGTMGSVKGEAMEVASRAADRARLMILRGPLIVASDKDAKAIESAKANAERANVAPLIDFRHCSVSQLQPPASCAEAKTAGCIVTNPPWGLRSQAGSNDLFPLYRSFASACKEKLPGYKATILANARACLGMALEVDNRLIVGGKRSFVLKGPVESMRATKIVPRRLPEKSDDVAAAEEENAYEEDLDDTIAEVEEVEEVEDLAKIKGRDRAGKRTRNAAGRGAEGRAARKWRNPEYEEAALISRRAG